MQAAEVSKGAPEDIQLGVSLTQLVMAQVALVIFVAEVNVTEIPLLLYMNTIDYNAYANDLLSCSVCPA